MLKVKGKPLPRVRAEERALARVAPTRVAEALGADDLRARGPKPQGPVALLALRHGLAARLQSTGGRPGLGERRRQKIPLSDADWELLRALSESLADDEHHPTPGQVASELLHQRLLEVRGHLVRARGGAPPARAGRR
jgi:hypothetical protein